MKKITGRVKKGAGRAAGFTQIDWVQQQCKKRFGFYTYPGTLNIEIGTGALNALEALNPALWRDLIPPNPSFCSSQAVKIDINGIPGIIFRPEKDKNIHKNNIIEVMSPLYLRQVLSLKDEDEVTIELQQKPAAGSAGKLKVRAVLFDLDGTLIDSIESYYRIVETALERLNYPAVERSAIALAVKNEGFDWKMVFPKMDEKKSEAQAKRAWEIIDTVYAQMFLKNVQMFPGTKEMIKALFQKGTRLSLVTATPKKNIKEKLGILEKHGILEKIDVVICSEDTPYKKPYPDPLLLCSRKMGIPANQCAYIGDVGTDIIAGKAAGMKTIGITTGFESKKELELHQPDAIISDITDLISLVL